MKVRTLMIASLAALLVPLLVGGVLVLGVASQLPAGTEARVDGPHDVWGVAASGSYAWVVPAGRDAVVIVDAGQDPEARALSTEVGGRRVLGIVLTHGHADTTAGVDAFPDVPVFIGKGDLSLLKGETEAQGWMAAWLGRSLPRPRLPEQVTEVADGEEIELGTARFRAVHMPGHTPGSTAWVWRDVAFVGDAVLVQPRVTTMMAAFSDDEAEARESVGNLLPVDFESALDARGGVRGDAREALATFVKKPLPDVTIRMVDAAAPPMDEQLRVGPRVRLHGVVRMDPRRVGDGATPELVADDGRVYRLSAVPDGASWAWKDVWNRPVSVEGQAERRALGVAPDPRPLFRVEELEADRGLEASAGAVERLPVETWRRGQWVELVGALSEVKPLSAHSTWGHVEVGGVTGAVPLTLVEGLEGEQVTVLAEVVQGGADPRFSARAVCLKDRPGCGVTVPGWPAGAEG